MGGQVGDRFRTSGEKQGKSAGKNCGKKSLYFAHRGNKVHRSTMGVQEKPTIDSPLGLYLHVPFCGSTCDFCAFYQEKPKRQDLDRYLKGIEDELRGVDFDKKLYTVFWGGGTPGLLPAKDLARLGEAVLEHTGGQPKEWSVEMAPSTVKADKIAVLKDLGVTRISMGVQTFNPELLKELGRLHAPNQVYKAYDVLRNEGFENVNLDLIFAIPGQTEDQMVEDLREAMRLSPEHLSLYCLTFEEDTALYVKLSQGKITRSDERDADYYERAWQTLEEGGYAQYEISNFARQGRECIHNINTWEMYEWVGVGPSASSQYQGKRYTNIHSLNEWLEGVDAGAMKHVDEVSLTPELLLSDALLFGLRMNAGVDLGVLKKRFEGAYVVALDDLWEKLETEGLLLKDGERLRLTLRGRLVADQVATEILASF